VADKTFNHKKDTTESDALGIERDATHLLSSQSGTTDFPLASRPAYNHQRNSQFLPQRPPCLLTRPIPIPSTTSQPSCRLVELTTTSISSPPTMRPIRPSHSSSFMGSQSSGMPSFRCRQPDFLTSDVSVIRAAWKYQIGAWVAAGYRVVVPDMLGYGQTDKPDEPEEYSPKKLSDDLAALLDHLNSPKAACTPCRPITHLNP
jgi:hypothetical protein